MDEILEELQHAYHEREIRKLRYELSQKSRLYEIQYELPPLPELRIIRIFTDSEERAISTVLNGNPNRIIKKITVDGKEE